MTEAVNNNHHVGSATMTILTLDDEGVVHSANIGDSGYAWIRKSNDGSYHVLFKS